MPWRCEPTTTARDAPCQFTCSLLNAERARERFRDRVKVTLASGKPVNVELLYPDLGLDKPLQDGATR